MDVKPTILQHSYYTNRERERKRNTAKYLQMCTVIQMYHDFFPVYIIYTAISLHSAYDLITRTYEILLNVYLLALCPFVMYLGSRERQTFIFLYTFNKKKRTHFYAVAQKLKHYWIYFLHSYGFSLFRLLFLPPSPSTFVMIKSRVRFFSFC